MNAVLTTTFDILKSNNACETSYRKLAKELGGVDAYGRNTPIPLWKILESNGLDDLFWCADKTQQPEEADRIFRLIDADFAESVLHFFEKLYPNDDRPRNAIQAARDFANGKIGRVKLDAARAAALAASWAASWFASWSASGSASGSAARAAGWAAGWAAVATEKEKQFSIAMKWLKDSQ